MNVLAINGSPKMEKGNTTMILGPFLKGLRETGANVDLFYTNELKVDPCNGDLSCWLVHPGECSQKDDMQILYPKFRNADVIVWATPVYYAGVTGPLKNVMDRQLPLHIFGEPGTKRQKIILVSTCGAWEMGMFDPLLAQMEALGKRPDGSSDFTGALLRPHADCMTEIMKTKGRELVDGVFQAARDAGRELIREGEISEDTSKKVSQKLMPQDVYYQAAKEAFESAKL